MEPESMVGVGTMVTEVAAVAGAILTVISGDVLVNIVGFLRLLVEKISFKAFLELSAVWGVVIAVFFVEMYVARFVVVVVCADSVEVVAVGVVVVLVVVFVEVVVCAGSVEEVVAGGVIVVLVAVFVEVIDFDAVVVVVAGVVGVLDVIFFLISKISAIVIFLTSCFFVLNNI